jgi:hypothetical protein
MGQRVVEKFPSQVNLRLEQFYRPGSWPQKCKRAPTITYRSENSDEIAWSDQVR